MVVVGEGLQPGSLAYRQAAALRRVGVDKVVPILRDVARYSRSRRVAYLHTEPVVELTRFPVLVVWR